MTEHSSILVLNAGSSSIKFALFSDGAEGGELSRRCHGEISGLDTGARFRALDSQNAYLINEAMPAMTHERAIGRLLDWLGRREDYGDLAAAGHRVVHGGSRLDQPVCIDGEVLDELRSFAPLAPLHMPHNLAAIEALDRLHPGLTQVACFDTAFHRSMPLSEQYYALPREWFARGIRRYGFHGLSYEHIASVLPEYLGAAAEGRVIVAHLGHGASLCAMHYRRSIATTMGFTPLDGVPMATRPGQLDPGVVTFLIREAGLSASEVDDMLNHHSGLTGLSGVTGDMRQLLEDPRPEAAEAVEYFVHHVHRAIASLAAALGGLDALVFTAGIGENSPLIRERICDQAAWLGIALDKEANAANRNRISLSGSAVSVWRIPTDEERVIALHTRRLTGYTRGPGKEQAPVERGSAT